MFLVDGWLGVCPMFGDLVAVAVDGAGAVVGGLATQAEEVARKGVVEFFRVQVRALGEPDEQGSGGENLACELVGFFVEDVQEHGRLLPCDAGLREVLEVSEDDVAELVRERPAHACAPPLAIVGKAIAVVARIVADEAIF